MSLAKVYTHFLTHPLTMTACIIEEMRFEVPQFIEIEDKIFGPFTWKQFVYLCGGIGIAGITFITSKLLFLLIGLPAAGLAALLAFYPVNNRPFSVFLEAAISFYGSTKIYYWRKKKDNVYKSDTLPEVVSTPTHIPTPTRSGGGINSLSRKLELNALQKAE